MLNLTYTELVWLITAFCETFSEASDTETYRELLAKLEAAKDAAK